MSTQGNPFQTLSKIMMDYVQGVGNTEEETANIIKSQNFDPSLIISVFWTFSNVLKDEKSSSRMRVLGSTLTSSCPEIIPYIFLTMDKIDWDSMALKATDFIKTYRSLFFAQNQIVQYQTFSSNPDGFSRLILAIYNGNVDDVMSIVGFHKIDPTALLELVFNIIDLRVFNGPLKILQSMPLERVLQYLIYSMKTKFTPGLSHIITYFYENGVIDDKTIISIFKNKKEAFNGLYNYYVTKAKEFCEKMARPVVRFNNEKKEDVYDNAFRKARSDYNNAKQIWSNFPLFTMMKSMSDEQFIHALRALKEYDPCQIDFIFERTLALFKQSIENGKIDYELMLFVGGHTSDTDLVYSLLEIEDLPAHAFSHFILPAVALSDVPWQLAIPVYEAIEKKFTYKQRYEIYHQFNEKQKTCIDQMFVTAEARRKVSFTLRRLSNGRGKEFSGKFSRIMLRAPKIAVNGIIEFITDKSYDKNTKQSLSYIINYFSPLSLDQMIWIFIQAIDDKSFKSTNDDVNEWPVDFATFVATTFTDHYNEMDLNALIDVIENGIRNMNTAYVCLFSKLVENMCLVNYSGDLTDSQFEKLCAYNYDAVVRKISEGDKDHDFAKLKHMKDALHKDNVGLIIISFLDVMKKRLPYIPCNNSLADRLDQIQFAIIESCDPMDLNSLKVSPSQLIAENGLSLSCAFHLSRASCSIEDASSVAPEGISNKLFGMFWKLDPWVFHIPKKFLNDNKKLLDEKLEKASEGKKPSLQIAISIFERNIKTQEETRNNYRKMIKEEGADWFKEPADYLMFAKHCIIPRAMFSELDASYCELFVNELAHGIENISIKEMLSAVLSKLHFLIISSTLEETRSYGRFICGLMNDFQNLSEKIYFHDLFLTKILLVLSRPELMTLLNSFELLSRVLTYFPSEIAHFEALDKKLVELEESISEQPENLQVKQKRYHSNFKKRFDEQKKQIQKEQEQLKSIEKDPLKVKPAPPPSSQQRSQITIRHDNTPQKIQDRRTTRDSYDRRESPRKR